GITQFRRGRSPYRGIFYWHHLVGLAFGLVTLTFVVSGLLSMNPWGLLDSRGGGEAARIQGAAPSWGEIKASLAALRAQPALGGGRARRRGGGAVACGRAGGGARAPPRGRAGRGGARPPPADLATAAERLAAPHGIAAQGIMDEEDAYYFRRRDAFVLPVYRVIVNDAERTRYYLDPASGALIQRTDANGRWHRWLFGALHRFDFPFLRGRPLWDV